jgi:isopenicillin-N epimerase
MHNGLLSKPANPLMPAVLDLDQRAPAFRDALATLQASRPAAPTADEGWWLQVHRHYDVAREPVNLENGFWGPMAEPVKAEYERLTTFINRHNAHWVRREWPQALEALRVRVARSLGCGHDELVLVRGASEAMQVLIQGYRGLAAGDTVLYCDLDYPAMRAAMAFLRERRGVNAVRLAIPEPATREAVLATYRQALHEHPRVRLVLLTHLSHSTGLVMPVRELTTMIEAAGADVVVDAAHSWGQMAFDAPDLGAPFAAFNLHKWVGAPLGCAVLYIRRDRLDAIEAPFAGLDFGADDIRSRLYGGTPNFAAWLSLPAALDWHEAIGVAHKAVRLRHLRDAWVGARALPGVQILTPDEDGMVAGITSFRLAGRTSTADNQAVARALLEQHGVFTVQRSGPAAGDVVRVTPGLHTTVAEIEQLVVGLRSLVRG